MIVGAGLMGRWHAHAIEALGERVLAVVDVDAKRAESLARDHSAKGTTDLGEALRFAPLVAHVCTPPGLHVAHATAALDAGAHVLMEKPFAPSVEETRSLLDRAAAARLHAVPVHQFLFQRGVVQAFAELPTFGPLLHADFVACSAGADASQAARGSVARDILPHALSMIRRLHGATLDSVEWHAVEVAPGEIRITARCGRFSVGILVSMSGRPTRNTARLVGERGTMHLDFFHGFSTFEAPDVSRAHKIARPFQVAGATIATAGVNLALRALRQVPAYPGLRELVAAFYAAARGAAPPPIAAEETIDVSRASERIAALASG